MGIIDSVVMNNDREESKNIASTFIEAKIKLFVFIKYKELHRYKKYCLQNINVLTNDPI